MRIYGKNKIHLEILGLKRIFLIVCVLVGMFVSGKVLSQSAQEAQRSIDSLKSTVQSDTTQLISVDSLLSNQDSFNDSLNSQVKKSGLDGMVSIVARDSQRVVAIENMIYLYKNAKIKYQDFELSADFIRINNKTNEIFASGVIDDKGKYVGRPVVLFSNETPKALDSLKYNFDSGQAITYGIFTEVEGGYISASKLRKNMYNENSLHTGFYSTCNIPYPHTHFGIRMTKAIVTENQIISGPAYLVIEQIPLKFLAIPFGFFPKPDKKSSGFLFPSFGEDVVRGFHMRDLGWYFAFNDYVDAEVRGTIYSKGSYEASLRSQYRKRYRYDGGFNLRFASTRTGVEGTPGYKPSKDFNITWNHQKAPESNPGSTFSASVNFGTGSYFQNTTANGSYDYEQMTRNNMSSSISYGKTFADGKVNLQSSFSHRQDISTGNVYLELPSVSLSVATFSPFNPGNRKIDPKWYDQIQVGYSFSGRNSIDTDESELFQSGSLKKFRNGFQHTVPVNLSLKFFKYFTSNTNVNYTERWYFQSIQRRLENNPGGYEEIRDTLQGFKRAYDYSVSSGVATTITGMYPKIGKIQAMRHEIKPNINLNFRPDFANNMYGFYRKFIDNYGQENLYSIFQDGIFGGPGMGRSFGIGFNIDNSLEAKIISKKDTTNGGIKKIPLIQRLNISGNYNLVADSFRMSELVLSGAVPLFNNSTTINFNGILDPYAMDAITGRRLNRYLLRDGKLARLASFGLSADYQFNPQAANNRQNNLNTIQNQNQNLTPEENLALSRISSDPNAFVDFKIPWKLSASFSFQYFNRGVQKSVISTINVNGDFNVTEKWKVQFNSGYDFKSKQVSLTRFSIYRDLHCWDMSFGWVPFGRFQSYNVTIRAKASILQDLKLTKRNDHYNR